MQKIIKYEYIYDVFGNQTGVIPIYEEKEIVADTPKKKKGSKHGIH